MRTGRVLGGWACASALLAGPALWACASNGTGSTSADASDENALDAAEGSVRADATPDADAGAADARAEQTPVGPDASAGLDAPDEPDSDWDGACVLPDATVGLPKDPGHISCGDEDYSLAAGGACCEGFAGDQPSYWFYYWSPSGGCSENPYINVSLRRACDEPADCPAGTVCCINDTAYYGWLDYSCQAVCPPAPSYTFNGDAGVFGFAACKSESDCTGDAGPCVVQYCSWAEDQTRQTQTCGGIPLSANSSAGFWSCSQPLNDEHVCAIEGGAPMPDSGSSMPEAGSGISEGGSSVEGGSEGGFALPEGGDQ